ncbi:hypothetical protein AGABI1DRAFT_78208 [Agaricus bisporus var. burnettii JB137-S8]|uniref:PX domain-containing protein n=1 Tax=Agaricus bisporus var. burnettii (strain JB137-S8 / ATCC MYA-4627 / FGSC 10392) TaxID=597362 RepID=K5X0X5_AGABU|nr:uncharacterized protein AGABI1DRAFT_78208 [Agaricus bisporus var. burnettii JB137-S8]EKM76773.1 hypothetical protein AGABI1DRAFT_78208 [Agaricus bisporus var. burnettii JB137-S8]
MDNDFDAGINSSTAWTEALDGLYDEEQEHIKQARALYAFEGKPEYRELTVEAGDDLEVIRETLPDGWSLVRALNEESSVGLLPRTYYTFTSDFVSCPETDNITPRPSPKHSHSSLPVIEPQNTGDWFRQNLLGGKSLNRFSYFVTSGAEDWILNGTTSEPTATPTHSRSNTNIDESDDLTTSSNSSSKYPSEADKHYIDTGPVWKSKIPPFKILVHSPSKRSSVLSGAYTVYNITSLFNPSDPYDPPPSSHHNQGEEDGLDMQPESVQRITVQRRFSQFVVLHTTLCRRLPGIALPPLPEKQYSGRFNDDFVEARRGDLERYINKIVRHPIARYADIVTFFLSCDNDFEWRKLLPQYTNISKSRFPFYSEIYHPAFNIDFEDASIASSTFSTHIRAVSRSVQGLRSMFTKVRESRLDIARTERGFGYALLGMITRPQEDRGLQRDEEEDESERNDYSGRGVVNKDGAWCWRENCKECVNLTKGLKKFSEALHFIADLYDDHARRTQFATHESLKSMAHPDLMYQDVILMHDATLLRYKDALTDTSDDKVQQLASRCETVLNTTMAEIDEYHTQKVEDFERMAKEHLDGEIRLYEQILARLHCARRNFDDVHKQTDTTESNNPIAPSPITPSMYTLNLFTRPSSPPSSPKHFLPTTSKSISTSHTFIPSSSPPFSPLSSPTPLGIGEILIPPLPQPTPHVFDSSSISNSTPTGVMAKSMRDVSSVVKDGVDVVVGVVEGAVHGATGGVGR